ncbi:MAG: hypothetical protein V5A57_01380 [Candidatus Paceibacterota bacterium]
MFDLNDTQKDYVILGLLLSVLVLIGGLFYFYQGGAAFSTNELSAEEAKTKATQFINNNLMGEGQNATVENVTTTDSLYKIGLKVSGQKYNSYMTKDGSLLFPQGYEMTDENQDQQDQSSQDQNKEIPQKETPKVELFVQSFCPYGNQAENTMKPVYELLGDKVDWNVNFIASEQNGSFDSLHGAKEVTQDKRELCVIENQGLSKWFDFATYVNENCGSEGNCWEDAISNAGLNTASVTSCVEGSGADYLSEDASVTSERGVSASPTLFINGVESQAVYEYGNPNAYKEAICSGFEDKPAECEEELEGTSNSSSGGSC